MTAITLPAPTVEQSTCAVGPVGSDGCRACIDTCPYGAIDLRQHPDGAEIRIDPQVCQCCGACSGACPTSSIERPFLPAEELIDTVLRCADAMTGPVLAFTCAVSQPKVEAAVGADNVIVTPSLLILDETYLLTAIAAGYSGVLLIGCSRCTHDEPRVLMDPLSVTRAVIDDPRRVAYVEDDRSTRLIDAITQVAELPRPRIALEMFDRDALRVATERRERLRILLPRFGEGATVPLAVTGFGRITVDDDACVACGAIDAVAGGRDYDPVMHGMTSSNVDGDTVKADRRRAASGFNVNDAMRRNNDVLDDIPLVDNAGGATVFLDSRVKLEKV